MATTPRETHTAWWPSTIHYMQTTCRWQPLNSINNFILNISMAAMILVYFPSDICASFFVASTYCVALLLTLPRMCQQRRQQLYCWVVLPRDFFFFFLLSCFVCALGRHRLYSVVFVFQQGVKYDAAVMIIAVNGLADDGDKRQNEATKCNQSATCSPKNRASTYPVSNIFSIGAWNSKGEDELAGIGEMAGCKGRTSSCSCKLAIGIYVQWPS